MSALTRRQAWSIALAGTLAMSISYVDRQTLSVLAPTVTRALGITDAAYGWLGSAFSLAYLIASPFAGTLVDRIGARRSLPAAIVLWSVVAALHALAPGFGVLFGLRLALGVTESPSFPAGVQIVQRALPPADRARGMSTIFVGMSAGGMLAPPLAIALATRFGWRAAFIGTACVAALWLPLWRAVASSPAAQSALDGVREQGERDAGPRATALTAVTHPVMVRGLVGLLAIVPTSAFVLAWEAKYYVRNFALGQADLAPYLMLSALAYDAGALLFGDLASRRARARADGAPHRLLVGCGAAFAVVGMAMLAFAPSPAIAAVGLASGAIGRGSLVTLLNSDTVQRMPRSAVSAASGVIASVQSLGAIVVNPLIGGVVQHHGYGGVVIALAAWTVPGIVVWLAWRPAEAGRAG